MPARALARIDLGAIERNCARLAGELGAGTQLCAVVKADGYGHGAVATAAAARAGGASWLAVAAASEAAALREGGDTGRILVMGALTGDEIAMALDAKADVAAWTTDFVAALTRTGRPARVHVKLDTGMGRLGTRESAEADRVADAVASAGPLELAGAWTHFATADDPADDGFFDAQLECFTAWSDDLRTRHPGVLRHAANSAATLRDPRAHFDLVRCGVAIYGMDPANRDPAAAGLEPALELRSYVAAVKRCERGQSAGYGRRFTAAEPTWLATLPIGYADGVRRGLTNNADVLIGGRRYPLVGTVSMDNVAVDVGTEPAVGVGQEAVLIGSDGGARILIEEVAARLDTINYEVACGLAVPRVRREYHGSLVT